VSEGVQGIYVEAWLEPRKSIRRIRSYGLTERDRLLMVCVNLVVTAISVAVLMRMKPASLYSDFFTKVPAVTRYISFFIFVFGMYWLGSILLRVIGRSFGGVADKIACRDVIAWWMLMTATISLVELVTLVVLPSGISGLINLAASIGGIIIFSTYTAEIHNFDSVGRVAGVTVATFLAILVIANVIILSLVPA